MKLHVISEATVHVDFDLLHQLDTVEETVQIQCDSPKTGQPQKTHSKGRTTLQNLFCNKTTKCLFITADVATLQNR